MAFTDKQPSGLDRIRKSDAEWQRDLTTQQYNVLRKRGTEPAHSHSLNNEKRRGVYHCAGCGQPLYTADRKFESGSGWPSFWAPIAGAVETTTDASHFMIRTEVHCARCGSHLGHVFEDGPKPSGQRYCMNGTALDFKPE